MSIPLRVRTGVVNVDRGQDDLRRAIEELQSHPLAEARLLFDIQLTDGVETAIRHNLGRPWKAWTLMNLTGPVTTGRVVATVGTDRGVLLRLTATGYGATITVSLLVV